MKKLLTALLIAVPLSAFAEPAFIDSDAGLCLMGPFGFTEDTRVVVTFDPDTCDMHLRCQARVDVDLDGAYVDEGFPCGILGAGVLAVTDASHLVASPSGNVTLQCHVYSCDQIIED